MPTPPPHLRSNESRDNYHEDGNLVPNHRCGFVFKAALRPEIKHFRIRKKCYFPVKFVVCAIIFVNDCRYRGDEFLAALEDGVKNRKKKPRNHVKYDTFLYVVG